MATNQDFDRDRMATWYANRHLALGFGVQRVFHLPTNAGPREIRFLEVNPLVREITPFEAVDFAVTSAGSEAHTLNVLDVTPPQWQAIQEGRLALPGDRTLVQSAELELRSGVDDSLDDFVDGPDQEPTDPEAMPSAVRLTSRRVGP